MPGLYGALQVEEQLKSTQETTEAEKEALAKTVEELKERLSSLQEEREALAKQVEEAQQRVEEEAKRWEGQVANVTAERDMAQAEVRGGGWEWLVLSFTTS